MYREVVESYLYLIHFPSCDTLLMPPIGQVNRGRRPVCLSVQFIQASLWAHTEQGGEAWRLELEGQWEISTRLHSFCPYVSSLFFLENNWYLNQGIHRVLSVVVLGSVWSDSLLKHKMLALVLLI